MVHAIVIGVNRVREDWLSALRAPEHDATQLAASLSLETGCSVPQNQIRCLVGEHATRHCVIDALADAVRVAGDEDSIIVYFAGHGLARDADFYLCTADASESDLSKTSIGGMDLERLFAAAVCRGIFVMLDCCEGAAFAEHAPATFRSLRSGEYRILFSAARATQRSWERADGSGTLFSKHLLDIITGKTVVGNTPGAIYFSDLVQTLDARIQEDLENREHDRPQQDMVFVGAYVRDPLILVHKSLSLEQVRFATARYSPAHVRRILRLALFGVGGSLFFMITTTYGILQETQYAIEEGGRITILQGNPAFNLPGYPKTLWTLPYGTEILALPSEQRATFQLVGSIGTPLLPKLEALIRQDQRAANLVSEGRTEEARELALSLIKNQNATFEERLHAYLVFGEVARKDDVNFLGLLLQHERREVRLTALRALMKVAPEKGYPAAEQLARDDESGAHEDVLRLLTGVCSPDLNSYLLRRFNSNSSHPTNRQIIDAAVRVGCPLSIEGLVRAALRPQMWGDADVAGFARFRSEEPILASAILGTLDQNVDIWTRGSLIGTIAELSGSICGDSLRRELHSRYPGAILMAMAAIEQHCSMVDWTISWNEKNEQVNVFLKWSAGSKSITLSFDKSQDRSAIQYLLRMLLRHPEQASEELLIAMLKKVGDDLVRKEIIETLISIGGNVPLPPDLLDSNNLDIRRASAEYRRSLSSSTVTDELLTRIGGRDEFYVGVLGRMPLETRHVKKLRSMLVGSNSERRQASCILAMQDEPDQVLMLLTNRDQLVRSEATTCGPFHHDAEIIAAKLPQRSNNFPIDGYGLFQEQVRRRLDFEQKLTKLPDSLKLWRINLADTTPGGWGLWGQGMRYWFAEQRYQLSRGSQARLDNKLKGNSSAQRPD